MYPEGTFNIEWFGTTDTTKHQHRSKLAVSRIADLIADTLDLEVVVLEEINSESQEYEWLSEFLETQAMSYVPVFPAVNSEWSSLLILTRLVS